MCVGAKGVFGFVKKKRQSGARGGKGIKAPTTGEVRQLLSAEAEVRGCRDGVWREEEVNAAAEVFDIDTGGN